MNPQVNWQKIRDELQRLTDVDQLKSEVHRIGQELRRFDLQSVLSPNAQERVKSFEKRYAELMRTLIRAQRQADREFNRIVKQLKDHRADVTKAMNEQKVKLERVSADWKDRFAKAKAAARKGPKTPLDAESKAASEQSANRRTAAKPKAKRTTPGPRLTKTSTRKTRRT